MKIKIEAVKNLIKNEFQNKLSLFVKAIKMDYSYVNQIMNGHKSPEGKKICDKVIQLCNDRGLDYNEYIDFF